MGQNRQRPVVLMVLDGWGEGRDWAYNAVARSGLKNIPSLFARYPHRTLLASGEAVGLPDGQMGNSEVGHLTLGAGRVIYQELPRISKAIKDGSFFENPALREACRLSRNGTLHLMGLLSDGGVHSHQEHLYALVELCRREGLERVAIHAILDGRDTPPNSGASYLEELQAVLADKGVGLIATVVGRYYAMDRDQRWERTERAYRLYTEGLGLARPDAARAVRESYAEGTTDEFVKPIVLPCPYGKISDGDGIVFFNFRADRARQISRAFSEGPGLDPGFVRRVKPRLATYTTFTRYQKEFPFPVAFDHENILDTFGEVVSRNGLRQLRMAETEKYAHVTFFFNGGRETSFEGEDRILIPSPKVATYDLQPEMSAPLLTKALLENIDSGKYDFILVNYANGDMVGHTGVFEAACQAARTVDDCVGQVAQKVLSQNGALLLTADHGNLERMREDDGIKPYTSHTTNPVPLLWISEDKAPLGTAPSLGLASIAPSLLMKMGLDIPEPMRATPLIFEKHR